MNVRPHDRQGRLVESREGFDPRLAFFYAAIGFLLLLLVGRLAYQQLFLTGVHNARERQQTERRIIIPGPRGNIYDRQGRVLVENRSRLAVVLYLDDLRDDFRREFIQIRKNYRAAGDRDLPTNAQMDQIAHVSVVQRYLDQVNSLLGRADKVDARGLERHLESRLLLPYTLIDDLKPDEFATLIERLPVNSPLKFYNSYTRAYPYGPAAAHVLGYVGVNEKEDDEEFPGQGLQTFKLKGTVGRDGLERRFDSLLQGEAGYTIVRVDPAGYNVDPPLEIRQPVQGKSLTTSLDIDLQQVAEQALGDRTGAVVAIDVHTGEVLTLASSPGYDLNAFSPRLTPAAEADIEKRKAWLNLATNGFFPPGSTFKLVVSTAALLGGKITPESEPADCEGVMMIGRQRKTCDNGNGHHGRITLHEAITVSCDIFFYTVGLETGPDAIAAQARRFHLDRPTGIELPGETHHMLIPDPAWKMKARGERWTDGDTANMAIGQGDVLVTPLEMACFAASFARRETTTRPTLLHDPNRPRQHTDPIGLSAADYDAIVQGMEGCVTSSDGTARIITEADEVPGVRIAGKTGTAQLPGHFNLAWFICFAPVEAPEIAVAVAIQGDQPGEFGGGRNSAPVAAEVLKKYFEKKRGARASPAGTHL